MSARAAPLLALWLMACGGQAEDPAARASLEEATITAEIRSRLLASERLQGLALVVETHGGAVTIHGSVSDTTQPALIRAIVARVRGVERVGFDLRLAPPDTTAPDVPVNAAGTAGPAPADTTRAARPSRAPDTRGVAPAPPAPDTPLTPRPDSLPALEG
ncbi:MAG TPA: BON domain-containing protein [Gemmatimonadota bacterium]|jgi:hypothetical protein